MTAAKEPANTDHSTAVTPHQRMMAVLELSVQLTLGHYHDFIQRTDFDTAKDFGAHQSACKSALSHLEALMKLQQLCRNQTEPHDNQSHKENTSHQLEQILIKTRQILSTHDP